MWSFTFNAILGFILAVTLVFTLGNVDEILASPTGMSPNVLASLLF